MNVITMERIIKSSSRVLYPVTGTDETTMNCQLTMPRNEDCTKPNRFGSSAGSNSVSSAMATRNTTPHT
jgi:hypothetical protein